jgi:DHA2 family multidrug resistance protein
MQNGLGNTLGLALMTTVLQHRLAYHSSLLDQQQALAPLSWGEVLGPVRELVQQAGAVGVLRDAPVSALFQQHLYQQATVTAYQDCFLLVTCLYLASMPLVLLVRKPGV